LFPHELVCLKRKRGTGVEPRFSREKRSNSGLQWGKKRGKGELEYRPQKT